MRESARNITELYQALRPLILRDIDAASGITGVVSGGGTGMEAHELAGHYHTGILLESQAPWALTKANFSSAEAVGKMHPRVHVLATNLALGDDHTMSGATAGHVLRAASGTSAAFAQLAHNELSTLTTGDHHTQYALLDGRSGGQVLYGGTGSGDDLYLRPTAHATKGDVILDQGNVGIGAAPSIKLSISGSLYIDSERNDSVFSGALIEGAATIFGPDAYWAIRTATNNSFNLDVYNSDSEIAALTILQDGKIGIGTSAPQALVQLGTLANTRDATATGYQQLYGGGLTLMWRDAYDAYMSNNLYFTDSGWTAAYGTYGGMVISMVDGNLRVSTNPATTANDVVTSTERFTILQNGYVGILDSTPTYPLDVTGDIRTTGDVYVDGGRVDFGTNYLDEDSTWFQLYGSKPMVFNQNIQVSGYASQTTGWRIDSAGGADFRYLFVDEMHAKSFIADLEQALAGGQIIAKSVAVLYSDFTAPAAEAGTTLYVRDLPSAPEMAVFESGDTVRIRTFSRASGSLTIADCWGTVSGFSNIEGDGFQAWYFLRSAAPNAGAMAEGAVVKADALVLDYGTAGNGIYEVNAIDGAYAINSPYAQVATWASHPKTMTVRARYGNLYGIFSVANEYGIYAGSGTAVTNRYIRASSETVEFRNVPAAFYDGSNNTMLLSAGSSNNSPFIALGATIPTGPLTNDGIWLGKDGSDYELRVGTVSGGALTNGLHWTGSQLNIGGTAGNHLEITGTTLKILAGSTEKISLDASGNASITGVLSIGTSGGIYQGSGSFASPTTGLKVWNDSGTGRIAGYNGSTAQWYAGTDGKLYAGGGSVNLDADGINIGAGSTLRFISTSLRGVIEAGNPVESLLSNSPGVTVKSSAGAIAEAVNLLAKASGGRETELSLDAGVSNSRARLYAYSGNATTSSLLELSEVVFSVAVGSATATLSIPASGTVQVAGNVLMDEISATPADPSSGAQARLYVKADKLIIQYNDSATIRYKYLDLTGTGVTWVHTTSAP